MLTCNHLAIGLTSLTLSVSKMCDFVVIILKTNVLHKVRLFYFVHQSNKNKFQEKQGRNFINYDLLHVSLYLCGANKEKIDFLCRIHNNVERKSDLSTTYLGL